MLVGDTIAAAASGGRPSQHLVLWLERPHDLRSVALVLAGAKGSGYRILTPLRDGYHAPHASADYVDELRLKPGARIAYVFDYGDEWRVRLTLRERVDDGSRMPRVSERRGTAPPQYPPLEDE